METSNLCASQSILIVDDNEYTVRILRHVLEKAGFQVQTALSAEKALDILVEEGLPDLAIVDYHMHPGMSGFEFCQAVHQFSDLPVIMLTAVHDNDLVLSGLENHVEDFIHKPFSPPVLLARVNNVLERLGSFDTSPYVQVDERLTINFPRQQVLIHGEPVALTPIETKLLYVLMRRAGKPVATDFILRRIWPQELAFEDRLHVHIHRLRRKIEDKRHSTPYIVSKRGRGYIFQTH